MAAHDLSSQSDVLERVTSVARLACTRFISGPGVTVELLQVSENATFRVDIAGAASSILRVHRLDYHSVRAIESELAWMDALRTEAGIRTPQITAAVDGTRVVTVPDPVTGDIRCCVMFELLAGSQPDQNDVAAFEQLGSLTARMHAHSRQWITPAGFTRFRWDTDAAFGRQARWGSWRDGAGADPEVVQVLERLEITLRTRLAAYGSGAPRFGLVHADTRLANLLVDNNAVSVIDFDDCGFSWYLYDLATAFSFFEHSPAVPELIVAWLRGYRGVLDLGAEDEADVWTFILFRRLLLVAWLGSHSAADIASELGSEYTEQTCVMAEQYMRGICDAGIISG